MSDHTQPAFRPALRRGATWLAEVPTPPSLLALRPRSEGQQAVFAAKAIEAGRRRASSGQDIGRPNDNRYGNVLLARPGGDQ